MIQRWHDLEGLYIHWPFCPYRCSFCPFIALADHNDYMNQYQEALIEEIEQFGRLTNCKRPLRTVFLGGGTPSTWPDQLLLDTFVKLKDVFLFDKRQEITIEVNPGTVRSEQLRLWKNIGINRLSIGVQTLNSEVLRQLNRHQNNDNVYFLLDQASSIFENISVDLIVGLPGVDKHEWGSLLNEVVRWPIKHISIYCLMLHEKTKLYYECEKKKITLPNDDDVALMYEHAVEILARNDFHQYEVSNFAKQGFESEHNKIYWDYKSYKGFGLGACSFDGDIRSQNIQSLTEYFGALENKKSCIAFEEKLSERERRLEKIMLGLRMNRGLSRAEMLSDLLAGEKELYNKNIELLKQENFMIETDGMLSLTPKGLVLEHEIIARFFAEKN